MKNREIKFRIFHKTDGMKYFGDVPVFILLNGDFFYDDCFGNIKAEYRINDSYKIMQYTGLQDKNGKDIYEGDILQASIELGHVYEVFHNKYGWAIRAYTKYGFDELNLINDLLSHREVIGNICQNSELIPKKQKSMSNDNKICVCPDCGNPLISTFAFAGAEWFCWECRWRGGLFYEKKVDSTPELERKRKSDNKKFDEIRSDLWLGGERVTGCEKCETGKERHVHHLTKREKARCERARGMVGIKI